MVAPKVTRPCPTCHLRVTLASLPQCPVCSRWAQDPAFSVAYIASGYREPTGPKAAENGTHHVCEVCRLGFWGRADATTCSVCAFTRETERGRVRMRDRYRRGRAA